MRKSVVIPILAAGLLAAGAAPALAAPGPSDLSTAIQEGQSNKADAQSIAQGGNSEVDSAEQNVDNGAVGNVQLQEGNVQDSAGNAQNSAGNVQDSAGNAQG